MDGATTVTTDLGYDDAWLDRYERLSGTDALIAAAEMETVEAWFRARPRATGLRHLDLGTCTGRYLRWSRSRGFGLSVGVDASTAAVRFCRSLCEPDRVLVEQADFLEPWVLPGLSERHGPFDLVTVMMGTVNHVPCPEQSLLFAAIGRILTPTGRLIVSSWRPDSAVLSLYTDADCRRLAGTPLLPALLTGSAAELGLRRHGHTSTGWHDIVEFGPAAG